MKLTHFLILSLLTIPQSLVAGPIINCPPVEIVSAAANKIDVAMLVGEKYTAFTFMPAIRFEQQSWYVSAIEITASNKNEAIVRGRQTVAHIQEVISGPKDMGNAFRCEYAPGKVAIVTTKKVENNAM